MLREMVSEEYLADELEELIQYTLRKCNDCARSRVHAGLVRMPL